MRGSVLSFCLVLGGFVAGAEPSAPSGPADPNETVCTVNGEQIRRQQVEDGMPPAIVAKLIDLRRRLVAIGRSEAEAQDAVNTLHAPVFRQTLREVVRERLMLQEARNQGLQVSDLLFSELFEREWEVLKARQQAGQPGYEEKTVRERLRNQLTIKAFRRQEQVKQDEDAWFRDALKRSTLCDGGPDGPPLALSFFFPNEGTKKAPAPEAPRTAPEQP